MQDAQLVAERVAEHVLDERRVCGAVLDDQQAQEAAPELLAADGARGVIGETMLARADRRTGWLSAKEATRTTPRPAPPRGRSGVCTEDAARDVSSDHGVAGVPVALGRAPARMEEPLSHRALSGTPLANPCGHAASSRDSHLVLAAPQGEAS